MSTCSVASCRNHRRATALHGKDISYHRFPKNEDIRQKWLKAVQPRKAITENHYICSVHFLEDDFEKNLHTELLNLPKKRRLKPTAVPSLYMDEPDNGNTEDTIKKVNPFATIIASESNIAYKVIIQGADTLEHTEVLTSQEIALLSSKNIPYVSFEEDSDDNPLPGIESKNSIPPIDGTTNLSDDMVNGERLSENQEYFLEESYAEPDMTQDGDGQESYSNTEGNARCRTCLEDIEMGYFLTDVVHATKTIKEMIIFCIPQMASTLSDDDVICNKCLDALEICMKFIENCLEVEERLQIFNEEDGSEYDDQENYNPPNVDYVKIDHDYIMQSEPERTDTCKNLGVEQPPGILENLLVNQCQQTNSTTDKNHQQSNEQLFKCPSCDKVLKSQKLLTNHITRIHSTMAVDEEMQENLTELNSSDDEERPQVEEFLQIKDRDAFSCLKCGKLFKTKNYLLSHLRRVHNLFKQANAEVSKTVGKLEKKYVCKICKYLFLKEDTYKFHLRKHIEGDLDICRVCNLKFSNKRDLAEHRLQHGIICSVCFKRFSMRKELNKHRETHPDIFFCKVCDKGFKSQKALTTHTVVHRAYCFYCSECGKGFKTTGGLRYHKIIHDPEKKLKCEKCPSTFQDKTKLNLHQRVVHEKIKEYQCSMCDRKFGLKSGLLYHYRITHLKVKRFQCEICGKRFGRNDNMRRHAEQHYKEAMTNLTDVDKSEKEHISNETKEIGNEKLEECK